MGPGVDGGILCYGVGPYHYRYLGGGGIMRGRELRDLRKRYKATAGQMAAQLGVSRATVYRWEARPKLPTLVATAVRVLSFHFSQGNNKRANEGVGG